MALLTFVGVFIGLFISTDLIAQVYVLGTDGRVYAPPGLHYVRTGSYLTRYESWGPPSSTSIVLVHGAFESADSWTAVARRLASRYHVEAYDLEGYGYTQRQGPYTTASMARQLFDFLTVRHLRHPVLVGHSLGAGVLARFVGDHPGVAAGIVFVDGDGLRVSYLGGSILGSIPDPFRTALFRFVVRSDFVYRTAWRWVCGPRCAALNTKQVNALRQPFELAGAEQALFTIASRPIVGVDVSHLRQIGRHHLPALVIFGRDDPEYSSQAAVQTARRIGAPPPLFIVGARHLIMISNPREVAAAIAHFVSGIVVHPLRVGAP